VTKTIDYYFSLVSPWSYLGNGRLLEMASQNGAVVDFKPIGVMDVFSQSGGLPLGKRAPQRQAYRLVELDRWKNHLKVPLNNHPKFFPADERLAAGMVVAAKAKGKDVAPLVSAVMKTVWADDGNISDPATLLALASKVGLDGEALQAEAESSETSETMSAYTNEAIERQVFGVPTYIYDGVPFWGQDRLNFLREALEAGTEI